MPNPRILPALLIAALAGCGPAPDAVSTWRFEPLSSPALNTSAAPQLTVEGGRAILSWIESSNSRRALKFAERSGAGWSEPQVVVEGDSLIVNAADVPSVRALTGATLVAHWLEEDGPDPESYRLPLSHSADGGRTWSPPAYPHHDDTQSQHGFASLFSSPDGGLGLVWLDGRAGGSTALWAATYDGAWKQTMEAPVDPRVCDCCQTSAAAADGAIVVAYRGRTAAEVRDIQVTRLEAGRWSAPSVVHQDGWTIAGCPVNGPAVSARGADVVVAWFTGATGEGRSFAAFSPDGGRSFGEPLRVDDAVSEGYMDVEWLADGSAAVSWSEFAEGRSQLRVRRVEREGGRSPSVTVADLTGRYYPRLAYAGDELLAAWVAVEDGSTRVRTARAKIP
jgi:hypothetical protein